MFRSSFIYFTFYFKVTFQASCRFFCPLAPNFIHQIEYEIDTLYDLINIIISDSYIRKNLSSDLLF